ncbi:hypothetical protein SNE40_002850 [Patella caerulea]
MGPGWVIGQDAIVVFVRHGGLYVRVHSCRLRKDDRTTDFEPSINAAGDRRPVEDRKREARKHVTEWLAMKKFSESKSKKEDSVHLDETEDDRNDENSVNHEEDRVNHDEDRNDENRVNHEDRNDENRVKCMSTRKPCKIGKVRGRPIPFIFIGFGHSHEIAKTADLRN